MNGLGRRERERVRGETIRENCLRAAARALARSFPAALESVSALLGRCSFTSSSLKRTAPPPPRLRFRRLQYHAARSYQASAA